MKTTTNFWIAAILLIIGAGTLSAQSPKYHAAMGNALRIMSTAENTGDYSKAAAAFERISESAKSAEEKHWPIYYNALNLINANWTVQDAARRDELLQKALDLITPVLKAQPNEDEFEALRGYALMAMLSVDPQQRGQSYSPRVFASLGKAMKINPNNPRAMALMARQQLGTSQFFGTEPDEACGLAEKSLTLYDTEQQGGYAPRWGRDMAENVAAVCK